MAFNAQKDAAMDFDSWWQHGRIVMAEETRRRQRREALSRLDHELAARRGSASAD